MILVLAAAARNTSAAAAIGKWNSGVLRVPFSFLCLLLIDSAGGPLRGMFCQLCLSLWRLWRLRPAADHARTVPLAAG
jgi:hypothetical protein